MLTIPANTKALRGRLALKSRFKNESTLSETHFAELIDSTLNKLDDRFFGVWRSGPYPKNAVVYDDASGFLWKAKTEHCSLTSPSQAPDHWESQTYQLQQDLKVLQEEVAQLKQCLTLLGLGLAAVIFWLLLSATFQLLTSLL
ncbi:MAG: hypothetical protein QNJ46_08540 [Leptolyngbyaceae cyanobacterium MO_188.B28]|nr:hypothetical protein [Leptolyngbyaceae cyanobacterium MO_188.B28]